jgi:hypothetical protein
MTKELSEAEKRFLDDLSADDGKAYAAHEAHMRQLREMCLAAKGRHYHNINQRRKRHDK